jgi:hypothetical protein
MAIKYKVGCFIKALASHEVDVGAHQTHACNRMASGIAPLLAMQWPVIRDADIKFSRTLVKPELKMGRFSRCELDDETLFYNLYGQLHWSNDQLEAGRNTNYARLAQALQAMTDDISIEYEDMALVHVGLPLIGSGNAGGDWQIIAKLVHDTLIHAGIQVTVYVIDKAVLNKIARPRKGLISSR